MKKNLIEIVSLCFVIGLFVLSGFYPDTLWGSSSFSFLSQSEILFAAIFSAFISLVFVAIYKQTNGRYFNAIKVSHVTLLVIVLTISFWFLKPATTYLGDGSIFISFLKRNELSYHSNFLDFWLHRAIYVHFLQPYLLAPAISYSIIGALAGIIFLLLSVYSTWLRQLPIQKYVFALLLILCNSWMLFFFGYVESYTLLFLALSAYALFTISALSKEKSIIPSVVALAIAILFHQISILLLPSLLYAVHKKQNFGINRLKRLLAITFAIGISSFLFVYSQDFFDNYIAMLKDRGVFNFSLFLPVFNSDYSVFSIIHIKDVFSLIMLSAPLALFFPVLYLINKNAKDAVVVFFWIAIIPLSLFFFFMNPQIGIYRDWDLFSIPLVFVSYLFVYLFVQYHFDKTTLAFKVFLLLIVLFNTSSWILLNHSGKASTKRFETLVEHSTEINQAASLRSHNYEQIADYYASVKDVDKELEYRKKSVVLTGNYRHYVKLGYAMQKLGKYNDAIGLYLKAIEIEPTVIFPMLYLADLYYEKNMYKEVCHVLQTYSQYDTLNGDFLRKYAFALLQSRRVDEAIDKYKLLLARYGANAGVYNEIGTVYAMVGNFSEAHSYFVKSLTIDNKNRSTYENLIQCAKWLNKTDDIDRYCELARTAGFSICK